MWLLTNSGLQDTFTGESRKPFGRTLISVFRDELSEQRNLVESCTCRHVRCRRPNDNLAPRVFEDNSILRQ